MQPPRPGRTQIGFFFFPSGFSYDKHQFVKNSVHNKAFKTWTMVNVAQGMLILAGSSLTLPSLSPLFSCSRAHRQQPQHPEVAGHLAAGRHIAGAGCQAAGAGRHAARGQAGGRGGQGPTRGGARVAGAADARGRYLGTICFLRRAITVHALMCRACIWCCIGATLPPHRASASDLVGWWTGSGWHRICSSNFMKLSQGFWSTS